MANLLYLNQYITTTLSVSGGINDSVTTGIVLASTASLDTTKPGIALLNYADPLDTSEAEWVEYSSINSSTKALEGVVRGSEGFSAKAHDNGVAIAFPLSESHINRINAKLAGTDTGVTLDDVSLTGTPTLDSEAQAVFHRKNLYDNAIINGNFDIWQRGTTATNATNATLLADRWLYSYIFTTPPTNIVQSRQLLTSGDITGSFFHYRIAPDGAGTDAAGNIVANTQRIENGTRLLCGDGKKVTLSFYARSSIADKKIGVYARQTYGDGGGQSAVEVINGTNWTLTSTWTKYTHTFTTNTLASKTFGADLQDYFEIALTHVWGSTYQDRVGDTTSETFVGSGNIDIAQVQLCAGEVALPFQPKSFEDELRACQRYYEKSYPQAVAPGTALAESLGYGTQFTHTSATGGIVTPYKVSKRTTAGTVVVYDAAGTAGKVTGFTGAGYVNNQSLAYLFGKENGFYALNLTDNTTNTYFNWTVSDEL